MNQKTKPKPVHELVITRTTIQIVKQVVLLDEKSHKILKPLLELDELSLKEVVEGSLLLKMDLESIPEHSVTNDMDCSVRHNMTITETLDGETVSQKKIKINLKSNDFNLPKSYKGYNEQDINETKIEDFV